MTVRGCGASSARTNSLVGTGATGQREASYSNRLQIIGTNRSGLLSVAAGRRYVVAGTDLGQILVLNARNAMLQRIIRGPRSKNGDADDVTDVELTRDEALVACGTKLGRTGIYGISDGGSIASLPQQRTAISQLAFSSDTATLWTATRGGRVVAWRRSGDRWTKEFELPRFSGAIKSLRLSRNDSRLLIAVEGERALRVFDLTRLSKVL